MLRKAILFLTRCLLLLAALSLVLMMLHVVADVIGKFVFKQPLPGTAEIVAGYYMIAAVFLPLAYMELTDQPIVADVLYQLLPSSAKSVLLVAAYLASMCFYLLLAWYLLGVAIAAYKMGEYVVALGTVVVWPSKFFLPLGLAVASLALALKIVDLIRTGRRPGDHLSEGETWTT